LRRTLADTSLVVKYRGIDLNGEARRRFGGCFPARHVAMYTLLHMVTSNGSFFRP
jgi:hypothetical protein